LQTLYIYIFELLYISSTVALLLLLPLSPSPLLPHNGKNKTQKKTKNKKKLRKKGSTQKLTKNTELDTEQKQQEEQQENVKRWGF